ncbi:MAG: protein kinase, partial [Gammaproteobacteria bacterium]|nr:protein kinase [Gammaproteobacteria bacterium]
MNILEFLHFVANNPYIDSIITPQYKNLFAIRLLMQSSQSVAFLNALSTESFFEEKKLEDEKNHDTFKRKYIINVLKEHTPQLVLGEILADIIEQFPPTILPPTKDLDMIDVFAEIVSTISPELKKTVCDKLALVEKSSENKIDIFSSPITHLRKGILYSLNIEKKSQENKQSLTIESQYQTFLTEYEKLEKPIKTEPQTKQQINIEKIASNIIRSHIEDFITILKKYSPNNIVLLNLQKELNAIEENLSVQQQSENTFFIEANSILKKMYELIENEKFPTEITLLKTAMKLAEIQANTYILQKNKQLTAEESFSKVPTLIKNIKNELTIKSQHEAFRKNIKSYLETCEIKAENIPLSSSIENPHVQLLENIYKKTITNKSAFPKTIPCPPIILSELNNGILLPTDSNQLIGNESYTVCMNPSLIVQQVNGVQIKFAQNNRTNEFFIVKSMVVSKDQDLNYHKLKNENAILNQLGKTDEVLIEQKNPDEQTITISVLSPYIPGYDLRELLGHKKSNGKRFTSPKNFTDKERIIIAKNIIKKYIWLLEKGLLHRDISHSNIRVNPETYEVDCIDFADALKIGVDKSAKAENICAQEEMLAPELKTTSFPYIHSEKTDVYALGIILGDLLFNQEYGEPLD